MKKIFCFLFLSLSLFACSDVKDNKMEKNSNQSNEKRMERGERGNKGNDAMKEKLEEFYGKLNLTEEKEKQVDEILKEFHESMRELMEEGQRPDREKLKSLISERDEKVKSILTEEEYENYIDNIEFLVPNKKPGERNERRPE